MEEAEEIVMTPSKKGKTTHIRIEKKKKLQLSEDDVQHVAGGQHKGLVVHKQVDGDDEEELSKPQLQIGFNCFLVNEKTHNRLVESRRLKFWYVDQVEYLDQVTTAYEFFKELVRPENFPRDYVGFIKKCMKQMQKGEYRAARKVDLEIKQLDDEEAPLSPGLSKEDHRPQEEVVREKILQVLESAYPNALAVEDLVRITMADEGMVLLQLDELRCKNLIRDLDNKVIRHVLEDDKTEVQMVKQMPTIDANQQPTIAIITANYSEKLAVDAMMEKKTTFVKFKSEGESNVYTMGFIGEHKVVSTKLSAIGHYRAAQIASGNTTTRLLGTFQNIEHVFIVGVAGGVPHYTDFYKHVRLGDVVISMPDNDDEGYVYCYCDKMGQDKDHRMHYSNTKTWTPPLHELEEVVKKIRDRYRSNPDKIPWKNYINDGLQLLKNQEADFNRPPPSTDRLYMSIGDDNVIEVQHPHCPYSDHESESNDCMPAVHFGVIGSGRMVKYEEMRLDFAQRYHVKCFDSEFDQVLESIVGNRKDSFIFIRGIADYVDGTRNKEWQPYASLVAAAMMKTIIKSLSNPYLSEDDD